ncbi:ABC transporter ATP-binding protein [Ruminococcus sp.]|uniref:ABC transporter ATP-binding protein n=1 Tax=Ruminococcus sp. TaxID=41978 RepID=UPI0025E8EBE7|nr:ABC transporter ATP-binding protein [Ruminococcus sp.]MBQ8965292.1 ABC transporter ATP-binding protein [Ruminococcus sp.]
MFRLFRYLKNYKKESIIGPLFKLIEACFELAVPVVMKRIIDIGIVNEDISYILRMGGIMVLLGVLGLSCALTAQYFAAKASVGFGTALRTDLLHHINKFSYAEIDSIGSSTLITRMTADINTAQSGVNILLRLLLRSPFIVVGAIIMAFTFSVKLTFIFLVAAPCLAFVIYKIMSITIPRYKHIQKTLDRTNLLTGEALTGARVIRAFSRQKDEEKEFFSLNDELKDLQIAAGKISALMNPLTYVIVNFAVVVLLWAGGKSVDSGALTKGDMVALINYMNQILLALLAMSILVTNITKMQASAIRINDVFDIKPSVSDEGCTEVTEDKSAPAVEFRDVSFSYHDSEEYALENISFTVSRGETVGIIGGTGSGKSSVINLIPRFYDVSKGQVLVDGEDVKKYPFKQLRHKIGLVPQRAVLFKGTVRDNLRWRDKSATDEELIKALKIAQAYDFVMEKKSKLDLMINQEGKNLSGGQRQRLTIARAFVGSPEIVILDDSASALDLATDARLRKAIAEETEGMTVFIVSQRISSIKNVDKVIVLDDGRIAGIGTHRDLYRSCDIYKEICLSQLSEKEVKEIG